MKVVLTGATGMVGEGVLLECLANPAVEQVLVVNRRAFPRQHPKLRELIVSDFLDMERFAAALSGYDACFFCAGISSAGMNEADYTRTTYDATLSFAESLLPPNPGMTFIYVSGMGTDSTEQGKVMWARVKGRTENALMKMPFKAVYCFRPGLMRATQGQENVKWYYKILGGLYPVLRPIFPNYVSTLQGVAVAMIKAVSGGYPKRILEVQDLNELAGTS